MKNIVNIVMGIACFIMFVSGSTALDAIEQVIGTKFSYEAARTFGVFYMLFFFIAGAYFFSRNMKNDEESSDKTE